MHTFTVWTTATCSYCVQAKGFLGALAEARPDIRVEVRDAYADPAGFRAVVQQVGRSTVPQIFLDGRYLGGWGELSRAAGSGKLDAFLEGRDPAAPAQRRWFGKKR